MKAGKAAHRKVTAYPPVGQGVASREKKTQKIKGAHETFARWFSSIRVQPSSGCSGWIEFQKKPRGGSRGAIDTRSFRLLDQEEAVPRTRGYSSLACVSTLSSLDTFRLTRSVERKDTHERQFRSSQSGSPCRARVHRTRVRQAGDQIPADLTEREGGQGGRKGRRLSRHDRRQPRHHSQRQEGRCRISGAVGKPRQQVALYRNRRGFQRPRTGTPLRG